MPAVLGLARSLKIDVVAEGVETELQRRLLLKEGCVLGQGFYFGCAVEANEIPFLLADNTGVSWRDETCVYLPRYSGSLDHEPVHGDVAIEEVGSGVTVLVIDDEPTVRMLIVDVLEEAGYKALEAEDGSSGLKILQRGVRIDLLITDVGLPGGMNGRQVADASRVQRPDLKILFVKGFAENAAVGNGHLEPGMEVITKPFVMTELAN